MPRRAPPFTEPRTTRLPVGTLANKHILLGVAGALLAGFLGQALGLDRAMNGAGFIGAIVGAFVILLLYRLILKRR